MTRLLYRVVPHNGGVVFAEEERAREIASIHHAIENSTTWGEFKAAMPSKEYEKIIEWSMEGIDYDEDLGEEPEPPAPEEPFDGYFLICEGDYPYLPRAIVETTSAKAYMAAPSFLSICRR